MVEVFKTDVVKQGQAKLLTDLICLHFAGCQASFDLEDCDRILRVASDGTDICHRAIIGLLESFGYQAAVLGEDAAEVLSRDYLPKLSNIYGDY